MKINQHINNLLTVNRVWISDSWLSKTGMKAWALSALCSLLFVLPSCSDQDTPSPSLPQDQEEEPSLTLSLPLLGFGDDISSRADDKTDPIESGEGNLQSLYLIVFEEKFEENDEGDGIKVDENNIPISEYKLREIVEIRSAATIDGNLTKDYNRYYSLRLPVGKYRFYFLGNVEEYFIPDPEDMQGADVTDEPAMQADDASSRLTSNSPLAHHIKTEEDIKTLKLHFDNGLIYAGHLPMACFPEEMFNDNNGKPGNPLSAPKKYADGKEVKDENQKTILEPGVLEITESNKKNNDNLVIYAPMRFLCSKARLTILFDNTSSGFSKRFTNPDIQFTEEFQLKDNKLDEDEEDIFYLTTNYRGIRVDNVKRETVVFPDNNNSGSTGSDGSGNADGSDDSGNSENPGYTDNHFTSISKTLYPDHTSGYLNIASAEKSPAYLTRLANTESWNPAEQRAWQSNAIYIPENLFDNMFDNNNNKNKFSSLHVVPSGTDVRVEGYYIYIEERNPNSDRYGMAKNKYGNARNTFYDIVAKMTSPDKFAIGTSIKVNAWALHDVSATW